MMLSDIYELQGYQVVMFYQTLAHLTGRGASVPALTNCTTSSKDIYVIRFIFNGLRPHREVEVVRTRAGRGRFVAVVSAIL